MNGNSMSCITEAVCQLKLIDKADQMSADQITEMGWRAKKRVAEEYTWDKICGQYEDVFLKYKKN